MLHIAFDALKEMLLTCLEAHPLEACGFLGGEGAVASVHVAVPNVSPRPAKEFVMEPMHQREAIRFLTKNEKPPIATYHSHPVTSPVPSRLDIERVVYTKLYYLIVGMANKTLPPPAAGLGEQFRGMELKVYRIDPTTKKAIGVDWRTF